MVELRDISSSCPGFRFFVIYKDGLQILVPDPLVDQWSQIFSIGQMASGTGVCSSSNCLLCCLLNFQNLANCSLESESE